MEKVREGYKMTELGEIPEEWGIRQLKEISYKIGDGLHGTPIYDENGEYYFINGNNLRNRKIFLTSETKKVSEAEYMKYKKELNNHTLLISLNGTIGNLAYYNTERVVLSKSTGYIMLKEIVDKNYAFYILSSSNIQLHFYKELTGTTIKNLSLDTVRKTHIPIPSLQEQQKIASILSSVDEQIEITDNLIAKTKQLKKGLMQELLTKGIGHERFKDTEIGRIPEEWEVRKLGEIFKVSSGNFLSQKNIVSGNYPVYGGNGITGYHNEYLFKDSKIVIGRVGAKCGCIHVSEPKSWITDNALLISDKIIKFEDDFMFYLLDFMNLNQYANQNAQPVISGQKIYELKIGFPRYSEQQKIASILSSVDEKIEEYKSKKEKLEELKKALMQNLLSGKIRVKI